MTRLLIVTDNTFYRRGDQVFDRFCFDRAFFDDYVAVFDEVRVAARIDHTGQVQGMQRADGDGVAFVDLEDVHGVGWAMAPWRRHCPALADGVAWADAICVRVPAVAGWHAARLARRLDKPLMFELIGDPLAIGVGSATHRIGGMIQHRRTRRIVRWSRVGCYVSRAHLQRRYPAAAGAVTASISSIRLPASALRPPRTAPARPDGLRLVFVGSFLPVKNHATLLHAMALARGEGLALSLTLVGDGPLRPTIEARIAELGLGAEVRLTGHLTRSAIEAELDGADLFVIPSWSEGLPRAAIEAMARGLPVIGSAVPGIRELLPDEHLFDPGRPEQIAGLITRLQSESDYRRSAEQSVRIAKEIVADVVSPRRQALYRSLREIALERSITCSSLDAALAGGVAR
jgi:phosphatidylinositol alpha-1,6-mannosyltransferase